MIKLSANQEDYLETIYNICVKEGGAKVTDISKALDVKKSSVSEALSILKSKNLITQEKYSPVIMTELGTKIAKQILKKHRVLTDFLKNILLLSEQEAIENACKIEHVISEKMFSRLTKFSGFFEKHLELDKDLKEQIQKLY